MANSQLGVHVNRRDGQPQRQVGLNELRLVVIVKRVTGERPAALQRLIVTELKEPPFFRVDLCARRRRSAQTNQKDQPGPVRSPIHAVVVTQNVPVGQADLSVFIRESCESTRIRIREIRIMRGSKNSLASVEVL